MFNTFKWNLVRTNIQFSKHIHMLLLMLFLLSHSSFNLNFYFLQLQIQTFSSSFTLAAVPLGDVIAWETGQQRPYITGGTDPYLPLSPESM